jgi:hypothetical protein
MLKFIHKSNPQTDSFLGVDYVNAQSNAKELSEYLRSNLKKQKISSNEHNRNGMSVKNPPIEIYEYQPFFLLERDNGEFILLDGFRRLLLYDAPNHTINIRIYKESEMTSQQIMRLLVYLNHFKFYGGQGQYYDRGFSLSMKLIFGLNIPKYYETFDAYLTLNETQRSYSKERTSSDQENEAVKKRLTNKFFVSDMKFIEALLDTDVMLNDIFGAFVHKQRLENPDKEFDAKFFLTKIKENKLIKDLHERYKKNGGGTGAEGQKTVNRLIPLYENIFTEMFGGTATVTFADQLADTKKLVETLKKDKTLTKLTGHSKEYLIDGIFRGRLNRKEKINFKCVVYPKEKSVYSWGGEDKTIIGPGLLPYDIQLLELRKKTLGGNELVFGFKMLDGKEFHFTHNYGGYYGYGKKYTKLESWNGIPTISYDVDVFVDITKKEIDEYDKKRLNNNN